MDQTEFALSDREFGRVQDLLRRLTGISLSPAKRTLVLTRLSKSVRGAGCSSFDAYLDSLENSTDPVDAQAFVNALTTNLTRFFREDHHFEKLAQHVEGLIRRKPRCNPDGRPRLRIWSAGCSTGQEPYTIALDLLARYPALRDWDFRVLATDIDTAVLARAAEGIYPIADIEALSPGRRALFETTPEGLARIPERARRVVAFKPLNLIEPFPMRGPFDAIFCRNVAIYFERAVQNAVFDRLAALLAPGGLLVVGHSETLAPGTVGLRPVGNTVYQSVSGSRTRAVA